MTAIGLRKLSKPEKESVELTDTNTRIAELDVALEKEREATNTLAWRFGETVVNIE